MAVVGMGYFIVTQYTTVAYGQTGLVAMQNTDVSAVGGQVTGLLAKLKAISLNGKVFSNPNFTSLQDWSIDIAPQTVGRANPYLPTYGAPAVASTSKVALPKSKK